MNVRTAFTLSTVWVLLLAGCASQSPVDQQVRQLMEIENTLKQVQAGQQQSIELQKLQIELQRQSNNDQWARSKTGS